MAGRMNENATPSVSWCDYSTHGHSSSAGARVPRVTIILK